MRSEKLVGAKGRVSDGNRSFELEFWRDATPEQKVSAIFELRELCYEVMHPGVEGEGLDRSAGDIRRLRDWIPYYRKNCRGFPSYSPVTEAS